VVTWVRASRSGTEREADMTTSSPTARQPVPDLPHGRSGGAASGQAPTTRQPRLAAVDMLRLVAALAVAAFHYLGTTNASYWGTRPHDFAFGVHRMSMYGWLGVEAFFLISGFVICMSAWGRTPGQFAVSRLSRLYPAYWCAIALIVLCSVVTLRDVSALKQKVAPHTIVANLTMAPGAMHVDLIDGVAWTLWVEGRFYLIMAAVLVFGFSYRRVLGFCVLWLSLAAGAAEVNNRLVDEVVLTDYAGVFVSGIALYLMYRFGRNLLLWMLLGVSWAFELSMLSDRLGPHKIDNDATQHVSWTVCTLLLTGFLVLMVLATLGPLARLQWRWLITGGALTYPFYLVHQSIGVPVAKELTAHVPGLTPWPTILLTLAAMLALSRLMNTYVEAPFGKSMRRALTAGLTPPTLATKDT
jgi:peptidoglycan/LPS O-acetylase OafA/YrhL